MVIFDHGTIGVSIVEYDILPYVVSLYQYTDEGNTALHRGQNIRTECGTEQKIFDWFKDVSVHAKSLIKNASDSKNFENFFIKQVPKCNENSILLNNSLTSLKYPYSHPVYNHFYLFFFRIRPLIVICWILE